MQIFRLSKFSFRILYTSKFYRNLIKCLKWRVIEGGKVGLPTTSAYFSRVSPEGGFMGYAGGLKSEVPVPCRVCASRRKEETGFIKWLQMKFSPIHQCPTISHLHFVSNYGILNCNQWMNYRLFQKCFSGPSRSCKNLPCCLGLHL